MSSVPANANQHHNYMKHPPQSAPGVAPNAWLAESQNRMARRSISDEHSPLLFRPSSRTPLQKLAEVEMVRDEIEDHRSKLLKFEFVKILKTSVPVIFAYMLQNSLQTGSVLVVGRLVFLFNVAESYGRDQINWPLPHLVIWLP